jgi:hypothetical protein
MLFDRLTADLSRLYPDISSLNLHAIVSCIPEDSFTEDKKRVTICVRNEEGRLLPLLEAPEEVRRSTSWRTPSERADGPGAPRRPVHQQLRLSHEQGDLAPATT